MPRRFGYVWWQKHFRAAGKHIAYFLLRARLRQEAASTCGEDWFYEKHEKRGD